MSDEITVSKAKIRDMADLLKGCMKDPGTVEVFRSLVKSTFPEAFEPDIRVGGIYHIKGKGAAVCTNIEEARLGCDFLTSFILLTGEWAGECMHLGKGQLLDELRKTQVVEFPVQFRTK